MITTTRKFIRLFIIGIILLCISLLISACTIKSDESLKPSNQFYIHDQNNILLNSTQWFIYAYSDELYNDSQESDINPEIRGSQVVVLTYIGDVGDINTTEIFNQWGIGQNDMGILIVLFFETNGDVYTYKNLVFEIGSKMSEHLSAFTADGLITTYFDDPNILDFDYDSRLMNLYFGVLSYIYLNVYDYNSYNHASYMDYYYEEQYAYLGAITYPNNGYILGMDPVWFWIILTLFVIFGGSFTYFIPFLFGSSSGIRGGGGKSIGYWFKR